MANEPGADPDRDWNRHRNRHRRLQQLGAILQGLVLGVLIVLAGIELASLAGGAVASASAVMMAWAFGLPPEVMLALAPKSVTAPVAMGIADKLGGIAALAAVFAVLTGLVGAVAGRYLFDALHISTTPEGWAARGFALGTAAHGIGAARALQVNADAGAYAALALGLQVVLATLLMPVLIPLLLRLF